MYAEADFCITGVVDPERRLPEGPFGDHLGYYSLAHDYPVLRVEQVWHRAGAVWPFTVVGRPPQEDTMFGQLIHELTGPVIPQRHSRRARGARGRRGRSASAAVGDRQRALHAVCRTPHGRRNCSPRPMPSWARGSFRWPSICGSRPGEDDPTLDVHDVGGMFRHMLERVDWTRDLHFQTCTTIDTLDYSGDAMNEGSKAGDRRRGAARAASCPPRSAR